MKKALIFLLTGILFITCSFAQLTGIKTVGTGGNYLTIAAAITALNTSGVGSGGVIFNVTAGHTETFTSSTLGTITASGTNSNPIVFQKSGSGSNPKITAGTGTSSTTDGIIKIAGGDYITFDGIDVAENTLSNTTTTTRMEWGYALLKTSGIDGAQNNTIKNCTITLNKSNIASVGIYAGNHIPTSTTALTVTSFLGTNSNNNISGCKITNIYIGISLNGFNDLISPYSYYDMNNIVTLCSISNYSGGTTGNGITTIYNGNIKILNDTITGGTASGTVYGIYISTATSQNISIIGNRIYGLSTSNTTNNSQVPIYCNAGSTAASNTVLISNNLIENCFHSSTGTGAKFYGIRTTSSAENLIIRKNIIRNNSLKSSSTNSFLACVTHESNASYCTIDSNEFYSNYITSNSSASFPLYGVYIIGSSTFSSISVNNNNIYNNSIQYLSSTGNLFGICNNNSATSNENYFNNNIYGNTHLGIGPVYAFYMNSTVGLKNLYNNMVYNLTGNDVVGGFYSTQGNPINFYNNLIYNLQTNSTSTGACYGITVSSGNLTNIYNNYISQLNAPSISGNDVIRGINITNNTSISEIGIYFNAIFLNATSSGTNFGTSGIYHTSDSTSTSGTMFMRNNIVVNNSVPNGTGLTVAYRRSSADLTNYGNGSNNNCLYAGTPDSTRLLFYDGVNSDSSITTFKSRVAPMESNSFSELPPFINTISSPYNLHLDSSIATMCESGGLFVSLPAITADFDGDLRNITTPDVGADEGNFTNIQQMDLTGPTISYTPLPNTLITTGITLTANISDASGVPVSGNGIPRLYWKINSGSYIGVTGSWSSGNAYTFTFANGVVSGDIVSYYIVAQDNKSIPNLSAFPLTGVSGFSANPPFCLVPPINPSSFSIQNTLSGNYTVGSGGNYATIEAAIIALNNSGIGIGGVILNVAAGHSETFSTQTAGILIATGSITNPIIFQKVGIGANPLITAATGTTTNSDGIIKIAGGDYITFDSIDVQENITNLTPTTQMEWGYAIVKGSNISTANACQFVTIKNCSITLNKANAATVGIYSGNHGASGISSMLVDSTIGAANHCKIMGNTISNVYAGISLNGFAAAIDLTLYDMDNEISGNSISNFGGLSFIACGITTIYNGNINILNNNITGGTANNTVYGIYINTANGQNITINGNRVFNLNTSNTTDNSHVPIYCNAGNNAANNTVLIYGNLLENGIHYSTGTGKIYAIRTTSAPTNLIIRKNIIRNNSLRGSSSSSFFTGISIESNAIYCKVDSNKIYGNSIASNSSASFPFYGISIFGNVLTTIMEVNSNSIYDNSINRPTSSEAFYGISNTIALPIEKYSYNSLHDNTHNGNGIMYGIYLNTATGAKSINNDSIYNFTGKSTIHGIYSTYGDTLACYNNVIFNLQTSISTGGCYGITLPTGINAANIYNNFIYRLKAPSASNADAIRAINITNTTALSNIGVYYNTIYLDAISSGTNFGTSGIYHTSSATATTSSLDLRNNIIVNNSTSNGTGLNVVYRRSSNFFSNFSIISNNNLFYAGIPSSNNLIFYDGTNSDQSIASYQTRVSPRESASVTEMPPFINTAFLPYNLHLDFNINTQAESGGQKITSPTITTDFDGDIRWGGTTYAGSGTSTDIGADEIEFIMPPNDAGMTLITEPLNPTNAGIQNVKAKLKNFGANMLTYVNIQWSVNGVLQTTVPWTGNLVSGDTITSLLGYYNFVGGSSIIIKAWTNLPNGLVDGYINNDTTKREVIVCSGPLSGIYTIGGNTANYSTINLALQSLNYCGVNGSVTFNINQGTYNEQLVIDTIFGTSAVNTITFKSANNDSNSVVISSSPSSSTANYVIRLNGADYIRFKHLTIVNTSQNGMGRVIELINKANFNEFSNNVIQTAPSTVSTSSVIYSYNTIDDHNLISNNLITGGYCGIYLYGISSSSKEQGNVIINNSIKDFYYYGLYLSYQDSITVTRNMISNISNSAIVYALYSYYSDNINYQKNKIHLNNTGTTYAMYIYYNNNTSGNGLIANNFISESLGTGTVYGVYNYYSKNMKYYYNSINITAGNATSYAFYTNNGSNNDLKNNSFVNAASGYAIYAASTASIISSNYNNLYATGNNLGYWGSAVTTLLSWQTASGKDANSISTDPGYLSTNDLHVYTSLLNNFGTPLIEVVNDIDGQSRSATIPDIGADEFSPLPIDLGVTAIYDPLILYSQAGINIPIKVKIKNFGADSVANFNVVCKIGNSAPVVQVYNSYLQVNQTDSVTFTNQAVVAGLFEISTYISLATDGNHFNDTAKIDYFGVPIKSVPYAENFDNTVEEWFTTGTSTIWEKGVPSASVINSPHSSPNVWSTKLNGNYPNGNTSVLYSPIFNNAVFKADTLKFWHWVDAESNKDGGYIEYMDYANNWSILGHILPVDTNAANWYNGTSLNIWTGTGGGWQQSTYKLSNIMNLGNTVQFRFVFNSDATNNNYNGWAIDDFAISLAPIPDDAGVIVITSPGVASQVGDVVTVSVTVKNFGTNTLTNIPVNYQIGSGNVQSGILAGPLPPGATANYTFTQPQQITNINYSICAYTSVIGDIYTQNDEYCKNVVVNPAAKDVGITELLNPLVYAPQGTTTIKVVIKNFGANTQTSIPLSYQRNYLPAVDALWTGSLIGGDTVQFTFANPMTVPSGSSFSLCVFTRLANDAYVHNDTICKSVLIGNAINENNESVFWLGQNIPNPTTGFINIEYCLPNAGEIKFDLMNLYGQRVYSFKQLIDEGKHFITLNINDLSTGVYYYEIEFNGSRLVKKMIVNK